MKSKFYILPGWGHKFTDQSYQILIKKIEDNYDIIPVETGLMDEKYVFGDRLFSQVVTEVKKQVNEPAGKDVIFGFSVGATLAYQLATQIKFRLAVVCSVSPILGDDIYLTNKEEIKVFSPIQIEDLKSLDYGRPLTPLSIYYGSREVQQIKDRSKKLHSKYGGALFEVKNGEHELSPEYVDTIITGIQKTEDNSKRKGEID